MDVKCLPRIVRTCVFGSALLCPFFFLLLLLFDPLLNFFCGGLAILLREAEADLLWCGDETEEEKMVRSKLYHLVAVLEIYALMSCNALVIKWVKSREIW